jgi:hypothetical protein
MFRPFNHIFKKYRIISYHADTAYVAIVYDYHWKAISRNIIYNETKYKHNVSYDQGRYKFHTPRQLDFEWYFGTDMSYPCHSWIETYCMVSSIEEAENMIRLHKKNKKIQ